MIIVTPNTMAAHCCDPESTDERTMYSWTCPACPAQHSATLGPFDGDGDGGDLLQMFICQCSNIHAIRLDQ